MKKTLCSLLALAMLLLAACTDTTPSSSLPSVGGSTVRGPVTSTELQFTPPAEGDLIATFETTKGIFSVLLYPLYAPQAVENFRLLAENGSYGQTGFHRVVNNFVIQGGLCSGQNNSAWARPFPMEITDKLHHYAGALCMVTDENGMHNSQFYVVAAPQNSVPEETQQTLQNAGVRPAVIDTYAQAGGAPYLDNTATVFGQVYSGMDVVDSICAARTDDEDAPKNPVLIQSITIAPFTAAPAA